MFIHSSSHIREPLASETRPQKIFQRPRRYSHPA